MKRLFCLLLSLCLVLCITISPATAEEITSKEFTYEELLAMDPELDTDGDGIEDVIEILYKFDRFDPDTDGDGVTDYVEFCITCTDVLVPDGNIDTDGDGLTNAEEGVLGTNPDDIDSDNDNLGDYLEATTLKTNPLSKDTDGDGVQDGVEMELGLDPLKTKSDGTTLDAGREEVLDYSENRFVSGEESIVNPDFGVYATSSSSAFNTTMITKHEDETISTSVSYSLDFSWFFGSNTTYNKNLAITSSILSSIAYADNYLLNTSTTVASNALPNWFSYHGFNGNARYVLSNSDQHLSEMFVGHKTHTYNGETKNIICVVIRGTNGTIEEWQSNFDVGNTSNYYTVSGWTNSNNHMGFDITTNRLQTKLNEYLSSKNLSNGNNVYWITGHSRGGALANLLASKLCVSEDVFCYTFASPATTQNSVAKSTLYNCIFNIINLDDFVPELPLEKWDFQRYGQDRTKSIESLYSTAWDALTGNSLTYTSGQTLMQNTVTAFEGVSATRNQCYQYRSGDDSYFQYKATSQSAVASWYSGQILMYPSNASGYYKFGDIVVSGTYYSRTVYHQPAFFMQLLASVMSVSGLPQAKLLLINLSKYLTSAQTAVYNVRELIAHPHYPISYYLLACNITS